MSTPPRSRWPLQTCAMQMLSGPFTTPSPPDMRRGPSRQAIAESLFMLFMLACLCACGEAPGWQKLLASRITQQYPSYRALPVPGGGLVVQRPGLPDLPVDVEAIGRFCQRGPKDCNYATDQMLIELRGQ